MTTIAWDGKTLAVDSRITIGRDIYQDKGQKLFLNVGIFGAVAFTGEPDKALDYVEKTLRTLRHPKYLWGEDESDNFGCIGVLKETGECWFLNGDTTYTVPSPWAYGTGADFAIAAMDHGDTAVEAVKYAATRDTRTNSRVRKYKVTKETK